MATKVKPKTYSFQSKVSSTGEKFTYKDGFGNQVEAKEKFTQIYLSLFTDESFQKLKPRLVVLYIGCLMQWHTSGNHPAKDYSDVSEITSEDFYFNWKTARRTLPNLYTDSMQGNFSRDMQSLVDAGFIEKVLCGKNMRVKNVYRLSSKWKYKNLDSKT